MCSVTDLEYRLISQLAYFDELTEELTEFQQEKFFAHYELKDFNKTISRPAAASIER